MRISLFRSILLLAALAPVAKAQAPPGGFYKVAFWYELEHPVASLKYQAYDLARGEYDENAVDRWFHAIMDRDTRHGAYIRDIRTAGLPGATEPERLEAAIEIEKRRWATLQRKPSPPVPGRNEIKTTTRGIRSRRPTTMTPGNPGVYSNPPSSPFPYPYRSGPR